MKRIKHINIVAAATILSISCGVLIGCNTKKDEEIIVPTIKEMSITGPSTIDLQEKGQLVVKEKETVLTSGLSFKSSNDYIATINELGEIDTFELGEVTITISKEGYKEATFTFEIVEPAIPLKRMKVSISQTGTRVGETISFIPFSGSEVVDDVKIEIIEGKDLVTLKDNVFTTLKEGNVFFRVIKEGYKSESVFFNIYEPLQEVPAGYVANINRNSLPKDVVENEIDKYITKNRSFVVNETFYTLHNGAFGIVNHGYSDILTSKFAALRINKNMKAISTSTNLGLNKVVIEHLGFKNEQVTPLIVEQGGEIATPTFGELENTFSYIDNADYSGKIYRQLVTYTFTQEHIDSSLTITGGNEVAYFNNIYLYGNEAPLKIMDFKDVPSNAYIGEKVELNVSSTESKFDSSKVKFTLSSNETGMDSYIEKNILFTGTVTGVVIVRASLDGFRDAFYYVNINEKHIFKVSIDSLELSINNEEFNKGSFILESDNIDINVKSSDDSMISITNNGNYYYVTALKVGKTNITITGRNYTDFILPVNVTFDESYVIDSSNSPYCIVSSPFSEDFKNKYLVTGTISKVPTAQDNSMIINTNFGRLNISDLSMNTNSLKFNSTTGLLDFVKDENESLVGNTRLVEGAKITLTVTRKDIKVTDERQEPRSFVGYINNIQDLAPTSITLEVKANQVLEFQELETSLKVTGATNMNLTYSYTSSNNDVATVDENGVIHGLNVMLTPTKVTITATCNEISSLSSSLEVTVNPDMNLVREITLSNTSTLDISNLTIGDVVDFKASITPFMSKEPLIFDVSDPSVIEVTPKTRKIKALKVGTSTLTVRSKKATSITLTYTVTK